MAKIIVRTATRKQRHHRGRRKTVGTTGRPRISVYRSSKNIFAQLIDDTKGLTLSSASTLSKDFKSVQKDKSKPVDLAKAVGQLLATKAKAKNVEKVVFDKSGYQYHGRVKALADGAREGGLKF